MGGTGDISGCKFREVKLFGVGQQWHPGEYNDARVCECVGLPSPPVGRFSESSLTFGRARRLTHLSPGVHNCKAAGEGVCGI